MKALQALVWLLISGILSVAQNPADPVAAHERQPDPASQQQQQLEDLAEASGAETEDEYDRQQLAFFLHHPLNINSPASALSEFPLLGTTQIQNLLRYRQILGDLISVYELQAVPGFSPDLVRQIIPYVSVKAAAQGLRSLKHAVFKGKMDLLFRVSVVPEIARGFRSDSGYSRTFLGTRERTFFRYKYQVGNFLQLGVVADKDAGESFRFNKKQHGFDFYSFHVFMRKIGILKAAAAGDFTINMGQGLIHWQSQAFNKGAGTMGIKRESETVRPYLSAGEFNFYRGFALTLHRKSWETSFFVSSRNLSANISHNDSMGPVISSPLTSGLHRTAAELADRGAVVQRAAGAVFKRDHKNLRLALNAVTHSFSLPLLKRDDPYNLFAAKGRKWANYSMDYAYTVQNIHVFGELAADRNGGLASVTGVITSVDARFDLSILYRNISKSYQSLYGNAFTENTAPGNENGLYLGISLKPHAVLKVDAFADVFAFKWLKYRVHAPSTGYQYACQVSWAPSKKIEAYTRYRHKRTSLNAAEPSAPITYPVPRRIRHWRTHVSYKVSASISLRSRIEVCWFSGGEIPGLEAGRAEGNAPETGHLFYTDIVYKKPGNWYSGSVRYQVFETDGYDTRLYAYENDLGFSSSIPAFFDTGSRLYLNVRAKILFLRRANVQAEIGFRVATTMYAGKKASGSGPDEINGSRRSELKMQLFFTTR